MAIEKQVNVRVTTKDETSGVVKKISKSFEEDLTGSVTAASTAFLAFERVASLVSGALSKVTGAITDTVMASAKAEAAQQKVNAALKIQGLFSQRAANDIAQYATEVQSSTGLSDELVKSLTSQAIAMGFSVEKAKQATSAAIDFASATDKGPNEVLRQFAAAANGAVGELSAVVPELATLTKAQLAQGKAIDVITKSLGGFAKASSENFEGSLNKARESAGDFVEKLGDIITQNPNIIKALQDSAQMFVDLAEGVDDLTSFLSENSDTIVSFAESLGIAIGVVTAITVALNAHAIAVGVVTVATKLWAAALAFTPIGLITIGVGLLTAAIFLLKENFDLVTGAIKFGFAVALESATFALRLLAKGVAQIVGVFNEDLAASIESNIQKLEGFIQETKESGKAQMEAARAAKENAESNKEATRTIAQATEAIDQQAQRVTRLSSEYNSLLAKSKAAFDSIKAFVPSIELDQFLQDKNDFESQLVELSKKGKELRIAIDAGGATEAQIAQLEMVEKKERQIQLALTAFRQQEAIKRREVAIKEIEIGLEQERLLQVSTAEEISNLKRQFAIESAQISLERERNLAISTENEIKKVRLDAQVSLRQERIDIFTQELLEKRNLATANAQAGIDEQTAAALQAREIELQAFRLNLEAQRTLAVSIEQQKQLELAEIRAQATAGTPEGAIDLQKLEVEKERQKIAELKALRDENLISEQGAQQALEQFRFESFERIKQAQLNLQQQTADALGFSPEALQARMEALAIQEEIELQALQTKLANKQLTEEQFMAANLELEFQSEIAKDNLRDEFEAKEIERLRRLGRFAEAQNREDNLKFKRAMQEKTAIAAFFEDSRVQTAQGALGNIASLMNTENKNAFEIGKKAAIADATIKTFQSAQAAFASLVGIPIVGPALATAAAAAAIAAGVARVSQIKSQKFGGGGATPSAVATAPTLGAGTVGPGGQADEGMTSIPRSLDGRSFILSAGERVVKPGQNADLTEGLARINSGQLGGHTININISGGVQDESMIERIKQSVIEGIREASERGVPIISSRGVV